MTKKLEILLLSENTVEKRGLIAEHGLSFWLKYGEREYLFDTGQGEVLCHNAERLDIDLAQISAVILSHGHDDHTGGLEKLLEINHAIEVFAHKDLFLPKYKRSEEELEFIGTDIKEDQINNFSDVDDKIILDEGVYLTGMVDADRETYINDKYIIKKDGQNMVDSFDDDISLYIETDRGIVILLGCSHKGVVNIIEDIREKTGGKRIRAILGGMHLKHSSSEEIEDIVNYLKEINFDLLVPIHCTGVKAAMMMKDSFGARVKLASVGDRFQF